MRISATYSFEAAHHLPLLPDGHKCKRMHGHNYRLEISVGGDLDARGFVIDYAELDAAVDPLVAKLDHRLLNDIEGLENPTSEVLVLWFKAKLLHKLPTKFGPTLSITVYETPRYRVEA